MESIIESLQCWWREKDIGPQKPPTSPHFRKPLENISCSNCMTYIKNEDLLKKKAKIGKSFFGFCEEECYLEWLSSPGTMLIGKLN